jgi:DNA-binding FadR family transcriptional regulator
MEDLVLADYNFHFSIIKSSQNQLFISIYQLIKSFMYEEIKQTYKDFDDLSFLITEHTAFLNAVRTGDTLNTQQIIRDHIDIIKRKIQRQMKLDEGQN